MLNMGVYKAISSPPTTTPITTIIIGSKTVLKLSAISTNSLCKYFPALAYISTILPLCSPTLINCVNSFGNMTSFLKSSENLQTQGFKVLADFLATSGKNIEIKEIGYRFKNRIAGESKMSFLTTLELIGLVLSQILKGRVSIRFILFCMVGLSGIFVQLLITGIVMLLINQFPTSQTFGIIAAMTSNYFLNNIITFQERKLKSLDLIRGLFSFYLICSLGAFTNMAIATYVFGFSSNWLISSFIGACFGAVWNFTLTSIFTWKSKWEHEKQNI
mgnify:CR=1 FL=1